MSVSFVKSSWPHFAHRVPGGRSSFAGRANQTSAPSRSIRDGHVLHQPLLGEQRVALPAVEDGDGHAPRPLARDAPVGAVGDHAVDALLAPGRNPLHLPDGLQRPLPEAVLLHGDEPLLGRPEQHRLLAAPAVRIGVLELLGVEQRPVRLELGDDRRIGLPDGHAGEVLDLGDESAVIVHRVVDREAVFHPRLVVLRAVARRRVDAAGPLVHGDVPGGEDRRRSVDPGVLRLEALQARARHPADDLRRGQPTLPDGLVQELGGQQEIADRPSGRRRTPPRGAPRWPGWPAASRAWWSRSPPTPRGRPAPDPARSGPSVSGNAT